MQMRLLKRLLVLTTLMAVSLGWSGCTRVQQGAAVGGGAGALAGGIWAHNAGLLSIAEGALVGGATGGLVGALIGDQFEDGAMDDAQLRAELENLQRQLDAKDALLAEARANAGDPRETQALRDRIRELEERLTKQIEQQAAVPVPGTQDVLVQSSPKGIEYTILGAVLFKSGSDEISDRGRTALDQLAGTLKANYAGQELSIEGHADDVPIQHSSWKSNWELGAARALAVLHYMMENHGFAGGQISATSFGEFRPAAPGADKDSRAQNRRAVVVVKPL